MKTFQAKININIYLFDFITPFQNTSKFNMCKYNLITNKTRTMTSS